jgi:hypothetical protein
MSENKAPKRRGIKLKTPLDARRLIRRIVDKAFETDQELEYSGRLAQLLSCWAKLWEIDKLSDIEQRLAALEKAKEIKK